MSCVECQTEDTHLSFESEPVCAGRAHLHLFQQPIARAACCVGNSNGDVATHSNLGGADHRAHDQQHLPLSHPWAPCCSSLAHLPSSMSLFVFYAFFASTVSALVHAHVNLTPRHRSFLINPRWSIRSQLSDASIVSTQLPSTPDAHGRSRNRNPVDASNEVRVTSSRICPHMRI